MGDSYFNYNYKTEGSTWYFHVSTGTAPEDLRSNLKELWQNRTDQEGRENFKSAVEKSRNFAKKKNAASDGTAVKIYPNLEKIEEFANDNSGKIKTISHYALRFLGEEIFKGSSLREKVKNKYFVFLKIDEKNEDYKFWLGVVLTIFSVGLLLASPWAREYFFSDIKSSVVAFPTADVLWGGWSQRTGLRVDNYTVIADKFLENFYATIARPGGDEDLDLKKFNTVVKYFENGMDDIAIDEAEKESFKDELALFLLYHLEPLGLVLSSPEQQRKLNQEILKYVGRGTQYVRRGTQYELGKITLQQINIGLYKGWSGDVLSLEDIYSKLLAGEDCSEELIKRQCKVGEKKFLQEARALAKNIIASCEPGERLLQICDKHKDVIVEQYREGKRSWGELLVSFSTPLANANKPFFESRQKEKIKKRTNQIKTEVDELEGIEEKYKYFEEQITSQENNEEMGKMLDGGREFFREELSQACKGVVIEYVRDGGDELLNRYKKAKSEGFCSTGDFADQHSLTSLAKDFFISSLSKAGSIAEKIDCYQSLVNDADFHDCLADKSSTSPNLMNLLEDHLIEYLQWLKKENFSQHIREFNNLMSGSLDEKVKSAVAAELYKLAVSP